MRYQRRNFNNNFNNCIEAVIVFMSRIIVEKINIFHKILFRRHEKCNDVEIIITSLIIIIILNDALICNSILICAISRIKTSSDLWRHLTCNLSVSEARTITLYAVQWFVEALNL